MSRLHGLNVADRLGGKEYEARLGRAQTRLLQLRLHLGGQIGGELGPGILVIFEGKDASGKGGAIKRVVEPLDPRHYRVDSFSAPTTDELRHNFLWRFSEKVPGSGGMVVFDRSWYGRVLVERVEGFAAPEQWGRAYDEIVHFERLLAMEQLIIIKYWMAISDEEQAARFASRENDPLRGWKLTDEDLRNREKSGTYDQAAEDMFARTDHGLGSWHIISADHKRNARVAVLEQLIETVAEGMERWGMDVPAELDLGDAKE